MLAVIAITQYYSGSSTSLNKKIERYKYLEESVKIIIVLIKLFWMLGTDTQVVIVNRDLL